MYFSPCIDAIYYHSEAHIRDQIQSVKNAGYHHFEFWSWWDKDLDLIESIIKKEELQIAAICTRFISLVDLSQHESYYQALEESIGVAKRLGVTTIISQTGDQTDQPRSEQFHHLIKGLRTCAPLLEKEKITLVIEPLNLLVDHPGYFLSSTHEAASIIKEINNPYVKMLFDVYHQQITEGNVTNSLLTYLPYIGHIHIADNPGRGEPGTGELNYTYILRSLQEAGYRGGIGLEFIPSGNQEEKMREFREAFSIAVGERR